MTIFVSIGVALALLGTPQAAKSKIQTSWWFDLYLLHDFGRPGSGDIVNGRGFDFANDKAQIAFAQFEASKAPDPLGFNLQLYAGRGPEIIHLAEPGGKEFTKYVRQAYVSYAGGGKTPVTVDFGMMDTFIGYEGIDTRYQDQYSRSFNWTYSETVYETGLRVTAPLSKQLTAAAHVMQGWNEVKDANGGKTLGLSLQFAPTEKTSIALQGLFGKEGSDSANDAGSFGGIAFPAPGVSQVTLIDFIITHQLDPRTKIAFNADIGDSKDAPNNGKWDGVVVYLRQQMNKKNAWALRLERMNDPDGLRSGTKTLFHSITGTYDYSVNDNLTLRGELRHDIADHDFFNGNSGLSRQRSTATLAAVVKF